MIPFAGVRQQNEQRCEQEINDIKRRIESGNIQPDASLFKFSDEALEEQKHCIRIADEKVALATQAYDMVHALFFMAPHNVVIHISNSWTSNFCYTTTKF